MAASELASILGSPESISNSLTVDGRLIYRYQCHGDLYIIRVDGGVVTYKIF